MTLWYGLYDRLHTYPMLRSFLLMIYIYINKHKILDISTRLLLDKQSINIKLFVPLRSYILSKSLKDYRFLRDSSCIYPTASLDYYKHLLRHPASVSSRLGDQNLNRPFYNNYPIDTIYKQQAGKLLSLLHKKKVLSNIQDTLGKSSLEAFLTLVFPNIRYSEVIPLTNFYKAYKAVQQGLWVRYISPTNSIFFLTFLYSNFEDSIALIIQFIARIQWQANSENSLLIPSDTDPRTQCTYNILAKLLTHHTDVVSSTLSNAIRVLSTNPKLQQKLHVALQHHYHTHREFNWYSFYKQSSTYRNFIREVWRLYPPIHTDILVTTKTLDLPSGLKLKKDALFLFSHYAMGRDEDIWGEDCLEFKENRWLLIDEPSQDIQQFNSCAIETEICIFLAFILNEFEIKASNSKSRDISFSPVFAYKKDLQVEFIPRKNRVKLNYVS